MLPFFFIFQLLNFNPIYVEVFRSHGLPIRRNTPSSHGEKQKSEFHK